MTSITLCSQPNGGCCPVLERKEDAVTIVDDFGGKVKMTYAQYKGIKATKKGNTVNIADDFGGKVKLTPEQYKYLKETVI